MEILKKFNAVVGRDFTRLLLLVAIGMVFIFNSVSFAELLGEPAFAPWGLFVGGTFITVALSHILRRALFPKLDLQLIAMCAISSATGAGLVFLGVCLVLSAFIMLTGSALRL